MLSSNYQQLHWKDLSMVTNLYLYLCTDFAVPLSHEQNRKYLVPVPVGNVPGWEQVQIRYMPDTSFILTIYLTIVANFIDTSCIRLTPISNWFYAPLLVAL